MPIRQVKLLLRLRIWPSPEFFDSFPMHIFTRTHNQMTTFHAYLPPGQDRSKHRIMVHSGEASLKMQTRRFIPHLNWAWNPRTSDSYNRRPVSNRVAMTKISLLPMKPKPFKLICKYFCPAFDLWNSLFEFRISSLLTQLLLVLEAETCGYQ